MCGRFTLATPAEILAALFSVDGVSDWNAPRYNIAPQTQVVTVRGITGQRRGQSLRWGAVNPRDSRPLINARSETVATSPLFARSFAASRVLVPADGFFEWTKDGARRQAHYFRAREGGPFAFAGIAVGPPGPHGLLESAAVILTTQASLSIKNYHGRMPLLVPPPDFDRWLDPQSDLGTIAGLISAGQKTEWAAQSVGAFVNNVRNDGPECIRPAEHEVQGRLF